MEPVIPDEAVEAAARAAYDNVEQYNAWEAEPESVRELYLKDARRLLEAAAPFIAAAGFERGYVAAIEAAAR